MRYLSRKPKRGGICGSPKASASLQRRDLAETSSQGLSCFRSGSPKGNLSALMILQMRAGGKIFSSHRDDPFDRS